MSELLDLANKLVEVREWAPNGGDWAPFTGPYQYADYALAVIRGYQELVGRLCEILEITESYAEDPFNVLGDRPEEILAEARASIPQEK